MRYYCSNFTDEAIETEILCNLLQVTELDSQHYYSSKKCKSKPIQFLNHHGPFIITWKKKLGHIYLQYDIIPVNVFNTLIISLELLGFNFTSLHVKN